MPKSRGWTAERRLCISYVYQVYLIMLSLAGALGYMYVLEFG